MWLDLEQAFVCHPCKCLLWMGKKKLSEKLKDHLFIQPILLAWDRVKKEF